MLRDGYPDYVPDVRFNHAVELLNMQKGGVVFTLNDLSKEEWIWLADLKAALEEEAVKRIKS